MTNQIALTKEQAIALSFAFTADRTAKECLAADDFEGFRIWQGMCDEKLRALFGMSANEIHNFGHDKQAA